MDLPGKINTPPKLFLDLHTRKGMIRKNSEGRRNKSIEHLLELLRGVGKQMRVFHLGTVPFRLPNISQRQRGILSGLAPHVLCLVASDYLKPHGRQPARVLCQREFSRQEHWSGLPCPTPGDVPDPGIEPRSPKLQVDSLAREAHETLEWVAYPFSRGSS